MDRQRSKLLFFAAILALLNLYLCRELFFTTYLNNLQSNEGALATLARFIINHPTATWFPLWGNGLPMENTYSPVVPYLIALVSVVCRITPALALHVVMGLFFCEIPIAWFWVTYKWRLPAESAFLGALLYSLFSPATLLIPGFGRSWPGDSTRLYDLIYYGDIAHMVALGFLPFALLALERAATTGRRWVHAAAVLLCGATVLSDFLGTAALGLTTIALMASLDRRAIPKGALRIGCIAAVTYLVVCPWMTPQLLAVIARNSQISGGDYHFSSSTLFGWLILFAGSCIVWIATRRLSFVQRFACAFTWLFAAMILLFFHFQIPALPQPHRYGLEAAVALSFLAAVFLPQLPKVVLGAAILLAIPQAVHIRNANHSLLQPLDMQATVEYRAAQWIDQHVHGERTMVSGDAEFWFNYFADSPQLSGTYPPFDPNYIEQVAVYTIYSGANAGARDVEYSLFWLKVFGARVVLVQGSNSAEPTHPFANPGKFEGILPALWRDQGDVIYSVPAREGGLAHVIPRNAVVTKPPRHGLDIDEGRKYIDALEDASLPKTTTEWLSTGRARIRSTVTEGQVLSVQVTYDPGWTAFSGGRRLRVSDDAFGLIVIDPEAAGACDITLEFDGGAKRRAYRWISWVTVAAMMLWATWRVKRRGA